MLASEHAIQRKVVAMNAPDVIDKDLPVKEDTRLLGRVLGDVLRAQIGEAGYERIEAIRQTAIRFRRAAGNDADRLRLSLGELLNPLPIGAALEVVRAFSYFSHLANIAEDVHQNRRRRAHALAASPPRRGDVADALHRLAGAGVSRDTMLRWLEEALVSPVLTAHPTEVQRKSILDVEREIARLLTWRDRTTLTPEEAEEFETRLHTSILELWQTAMLRLSRLRVKDEIDNGLAYYRYTFLDAIPRLYTAFEKIVERRVRYRPRGGSRVSSHRLVDRRRSRRQSVRGRRHAVVCDPRAIRRGIRALSRRGALPGCRVVAVESAGDAVRRARSHWLRRQTMSIRIARTSPIGRH